jgi:hypothetical protein
MTLLMLLALSGCGMFSTVGEAEYSMTTVLNKDGTVHSFSVDIHNTKDIGEVLATITMPDGTTVLLQEKGVDASSPMRVVAESNSKLVENMLTLIPVIP